MVKTVTLAADTPQKVTFEGAYPYYWIDNKTASDVYASVGVPEADADDTYTIAAGSQLRISGGVGNDGITLLGEGKVQIIASTIAACPFKVAPAVGGGGGSDTVDEFLNIASTNPVQNKAIKAELDKKANSKHSHSVADISDFPDIPDENAISEMGFTKNGGDYSKPDGGIPKSDLAADVRASLDKAETALQEHQSLTGYVKNDDKRLTNARPANGGNADTVNRHTVNADVPADAVFTDTTYEPATTSSDGLMSAADKKKLEMAAVSMSMQKGTVTLTTKTSTGVKITFPTPFKSIPTLLLSIDDNGFNSSRKAESVTFDNLDKTGVNIRAWMTNNDNIRDLSCTVHWVAFGEIEV